MTQILCHDNLIRYANTQKTFPYAKTEDTILIRMHGTRDKKALSARLVI